jgi:hypothetical protein
VTYYLVWLCGDSLSIASAVTNLARLHIRARCESVLRSIVVSLNLVFYSPKKFMGVLLLFWTRYFFQSLVTRMLACIERRTLILLRRTMLKTAMLLTVWYMQASFLQSATFDIADVKLCKARSAYYWPLASEVLASKFDC